MHCIVCCFRPISDTSIGEDHALQFYFCSPGFHLVWGIKLILSFKEKIFLTPRLAKGQASFLYHLMSVVVILFLFLYPSQLNGAKLCRDDNKEGEVQIYTNKVDLQWGGDSRGLKGGIEVNLSKKTLN
jgi:hypothetical protein